jgi:hypothetical protein
MCKDNLRRSCQASVEAEAAAGERGLALQWQDGYGAFSVSRNSIR